MRNLLAATLVVVAALVVANMLGVAAAEAPTTSPARTVSVQGVATVPIPQGANLAVATAAYRQGMAAAIADGKGKAEFLAGKAEATLGGAQSVIEEGGWIGCKHTEEPNELQESRYAEYEGEQPDFGSAESVLPIRVGAARAAPLVQRSAPKRRKKKVTRPTARKAAAAATCTLTTQVLLVYAIA